MVTNYWGMGIAFPPSSNTYRTSLNRMDGPFQGSPSLDNHKTISLGPYACCTCKSKCGLHVNIKLHFFKLHRDTFLKLNWNSEPAWSNWKACVTLVWQLINKRQLWPRHVLLMWNVWVSLHHNHRQNVIKELLCNRGLISAVVVEGEQFYIVSWGISELDWVEMKDLLE